MSTRNTCKFSVLCQIPKGISPCETRDFAEHGNLTVRQLNVLVKTANLRLFCSVSYVFIFFNGCLSVNLFSSNLLVSWNNILYM